MVMNELNGGEANKVAPLCFVWMEDYLDLYMAANDLHAERHSYDVGATGSGVVQVERGLTAFGFFVGVDAATTSDFSGSALAVASTAEVGCSVEVDAATAGGGSGSVLAAPGAASGSSLAVAGMAEVEFSVEVDATAAGGVSGTGLAAADAGGSGGINAAGSRVVQGSSVSMRASQFWQAPMAGFFKIHCDAAMKVDSFRWGSDSGLLSCVHYGYFLRRTW